MPKFKFVITDKMKLSRRARIVQSMMDIDVLLNKSEAAQFRDEFLAEEMRVPEFFLRSLEEEKGRGRRITRWTREDYGKIFEAKEEKARLMARFQEEKRRDPYGEALRTIAGTYPMGGKLVGVKSWERMFTLMWPKGE